MSHRRTVCATKLREEIANQEELALNYRIDLKRTKKDLEAKKKNFDDKEASLEQKVLDV